MKKNRLRLVLIVFLIAFFVLLYRLFDLTIIQGEEYREFSDNNRIKQINLNATRGNIYDHNGEELATNKLVYNLNLYSDRFNRIEKERRKDILIDITTILEEDGLDYLSDYFLGIYEFMYRDENDYFQHDKLPSNYVIDLIQENHILDQILNKSFAINDEIKFYPIKRTRDYLELRGKDLPIELNTDDGIKLDFIENDDYFYLIESKEINSGTDPLEYMISQVEEDDSFILYLITHPLSRKIVYDVLVENNLQGDIVLSDLVFPSDIDYLENKAILNRYSSKVTLDSNPKDDFLNLVKEHALPTLLSTSYMKQDSRVIPASILISMLERENPELRLTYQVDEENSTVTILFKDQELQDTNGSALETLIAEANRAGIVDQYILDENVINYAERALFDNGIYPRIYKSTWKYSYLSDKQDLLEKYEDISSADELFQHLRQEYDLLDEDPYLSFGAIYIMDEVDAQGYLAYSPINIASNLSTESHLKIEESIPKDSGFEVISQPTRFYPNGNLASHALGYIGSISETYELDNYVEYKQYDLNDIVGKTGLEESFENTLRGSKGSQLVYTDVYGRTTETIEQIEGVPGNNLYTSIDLDFQKEVQDILHDSMEATRVGANYSSYYGNYPTEIAQKTEIGVALVMDVKTGGILSMVSLPNYDPNLFVNGISNFDWTRLNNFDPDDIYAPRPILNNATQSAFTPGSTFKTVTSLAALEKGLDPTDPINNFGFVQIGDNRFHDLIYTDYGRRWGWLNLYDALKNSSNYYFYVLGLGYNPNQENDNDVQVTLADMESITSRLGLQSPTGIEINIPFESSGQHPNLSGKREILKSQLSQYLRQYLKEYAKENVVIEDTKLENDIDTIVAWIDKGKEISRSQVAESLNDMGYDPYKVINNGQDSITDVIKYSFLNMAEWKVTDSMNMVIGQGQNAYTPMQMVQLTSIIANNGTLVEPTLVSKIQNYNNTSDIYVQTPTVRETGVESQLFTELKEGMRRASSTAYLRDKLPYELGSKTGTAQIGSIDPDTGETYRPFVSEIAFAPFEDPEIAIYVSMVEGEKSANVRAAVTDIVYAYYKYVKDDPEYNLTRPGSVFEREEIENNTSNYYGQ